MLLLRTPELELHNHQKLIIDHIVFFFVLGGGVNKNLKVHTTENSWQDELLWGAAWLRRASKEGTYLDYIQNNGKTLGAEDSTNEFGWDNKHAGINVLVSKVCLHQSPPVSEHTFCSCNKFRETSVADTKRKWVPNLVTGVHRWRGAISAILQGVCRWIHLHTDSGVVVSAHHVHARGHDLQAWRQQHAACYIHFVPAPDLCQVPLQFLAHCQLWKCFGWSCHSSAASQKAGSTSIPKYN